MTDLPPAQRIRLPAATGVRGTHLDPIELSIHEAGEGFPVVLCHGFPELAYSWRHQVEALSNGGFRAIAPDQRGYGASDRPEPIDAYDFEHLCGDLARLLDALDIEKAVFAGHDWGGFVAWAMPLAYPDRCAGIIGVNTPYMSFGTTGCMRALVPNDENLYILWFQEPGVAEATLDANVRLCFEKLMRRGFVPEAGAGTLAERAASGGEQDANPFRRLDEIPELGERLLEEEELRVYVEAFERTGFRGGINWYRNIDRNFETFPELGSRVLDLPCLMVTAELDLALRPELAAGMPALCSDLEIHQIAGAGHWTQQDRPAELDAILLDWLGKRFA